MIHSDVLLHLSLIDGIGPAVLEKMLAHIPHDLQDLYILQEHDFVRQYYLTPQQAKRLCAGLSNKKILDEEKDLLSKSNISLLTIIDSDYPALLRQIHLPPIVLYVQGNISALHTKSLAVVGARKANHYGQRIINTIVPELIQKEWTIVSGGALGADYMAHKATLQAQGKTIAVLGSGLLKPYPAFHKHIFNDIVQHGGAVVSSFPLTMQGLPGNFPARNRIIAGLSQGCLVVQAAERSGALITAQFAVEQGREVFAIPGSIDDPLSQGCHGLIKQGATLVHDCSDILACFGEEEKEESCQTQQSMRPSKSSTSSILPEEDAALLAVCATPQAFDELLAKTGQDYAFLQEKLFSLQLEGLLKQDLAGHWIAR